MADYIDREEIYRKACRGCTRHGDEIGTCYLEEPCEELQAEFTIAPAADVVPVRHGRWILEPTNPYDDPSRKNRMIKRCSVCYWENACQYHYCPNCGAKMDEKEMEE